MNDIVSALRSAVPKPLKKSVKQLYFAVLDFSDAALRRREMIPPRSMNFVGTGDFKATGVEFRKLFIEYGGLRPEHRVLDVGCGIGRMAVPLTSYLSSTAEYEGFDIVKSGITWCQENISTRYPNFHFRHFDISNKDYNPDGIDKAWNYQFPYESGSFDFIFLTSVFTHMLLPDMENYLREICRVLKQNGSCFITFFLMNEESKNLVRNELSTRNFIHEIEGGFTTTPENPEAAVAFREGYIRTLFGKLGLSIREPVQFGSWCGRKSFLSYQDIVIATKN